MRVTAIQVDSPEYAATLDLRNRLLRIPLGLDVYREDLAVERSQWHFGLYDDDLLVGCVVVVPLGHGAAKVRQMAIETDHQRQGLGRQLLEEVERTLRQRNMARVELHARLEAEGFYKQLGYHRTGDVFIEVGIAHVAMHKSL